MTAFTSRTELPRLSLALVLISTSAALTACGSNKISIDDLPAEVEWRACARAVACGGAESQSSCESTLFVAESSSLKTLVAAVKRGTVDYDGESADACLDAITTTDCAELRAEPAACDKTFRGKVAAGGVCVISAECAGGGQCLEPDTCTASCCVGTCAAVAPPAALGAACNVLASKPCVEGAFCASDGTCAPRRAVGASCTGAPDECLDPAVCLFLPDGETCTVISTAPGAACFPGANYGCGRDDETCNATTSICTKRAPVGSACQSSSDCVGFAYCDVNAGTCKARPTVGQACDYATGTYCLGDLSCSNGVCATPAVGTACEP